MVSLTPQISMMAMIAPTGVLSGMARYAPISPSRSLTLMFCVFIGPPYVSEPHQLARVAGKDLRALRLGDLQRVHGRDRIPDQPAALLGAERRVGGEQAARGLEEGVAAAGRRDLAVERGVGIEHLVVSARMLLQASLLGSGIALGC